MERSALQIAVTGESGCVKSSFINAIWRVRNSKKDAAETGVKEATKKPTPYACSHYPNVIFYDLPGFGFRNYKPETYPKDVNFIDYNFITVSTKQF